MAKPQVTVTLGRSGQRVVKESWVGSNDGRASATTPSGSKRSSAVTLGIGADNLYTKNKKRKRENLSSRRHGYSSHRDDSGIGPRDLRSKLTLKRISKQVQLENEQRKKTELHEKVSRAIKSLESPDHDLNKSAPSMSKVAETQLQGSKATSSYASLTSNRGRTRSPERIPKSYAGISTPRSSVVDELPQITSSGLIERVPVYDTLEFSRPKMPPMITNARRPLGSGQLIPEPPPQTGGMSGSPYKDKQQPLTVSGLLHSLGLGKYSIIFQAEEIDMVALKQMGDSDLKELGVPMGPRKKILQALQARLKRPLIQAPVNRIMIS